MCAVWKSLGRQLRIADSTLDQIEADNIKEGQYEQCYCMLTTWTEVQTDPPTYQQLGQALQHETVGRPDIAKKYCCDSDDEESVEMSTGKYKSHQPPLFFSLVHPCLRSHMRCYLHPLLTSWPVVFVSLNLVAVPTFGILINFVTQPLYYLGSLYQDVGQI